MHLITMIVPGEPGSFEIRMQLVFHGSARLAVEYAEHARALLREGLNIEREAIEKAFLEGKAPLDAIPIDPPINEHQRILDGLARGEA